MSALLPEQCPRFNGCSANICPLDQDWRKRSHIQNERVCGLLTENVKPGGEARLKGVLPAELVEQVVGQRGSIAARWGAIKRRLNDAATTGSRLENVEHLRAAAK